MHHSLTLSRRSGLPSALDNGGLRLAPLTLTVGDYVLSKNVVVERKAPGDLRSSLNSGRLFTQMEQMEQYVTNASARACGHPPTPLLARRYYKTPTLLIEFDDSRGSSDFTLITDDKDLMSEPSHESIITKLAVLTMKFNKARYLWSRNPRETVEIFKAMKVSHTSGTSAERSSFD